MGGLLSLFEVRYFLVFVMLFMIMTGYYLLNAAYAGYMPERAQIRSIILIAAAIIVVLLTILVITVFM